MIRGTLFAAMVALLALPARSETFAVEDPARWGTPEQIVLPDYPPEALKEGRVGYVDVVGRVSPLHELQAQEYTPDSPASEPFVAALKEVVRYWSFYPPVGADCRPIEEVTRLRVWFEIAEGKPKISVSRGPAGGPRLPRMLKATRKRDPGYPHRMLREGLQAYVYAGMRVGPEGEVTGVTTDVFPAETRDRLEDFASATQLALSGWRFPPAEADATPRTACVEVHFRIRN